MRTNGDGPLTRSVETGMRYEVMEMHLFDGNARDEEALCGADTSTEGRMGVDYYVDCRRRGAPVGTVCEGCKTLAVPFAENRVRDLEADGDADEAEEFRRLAGTLARETGLDRSGD